MPLYYHIHRGKKSSKLEKQFINNNLLFFSKKNSGWYNMEKDIGQTNFGGYKIYIPDNMFTTSFNPRTKNKIVKITKNNLEEYKKIVKKYGKKYFLQNKNIIGIDSTFEHPNNFVQGPPEGYIWKKPKEIKIINVF